LVILLLFNQFCIYVELLQKGLEFFRENTAFQDTDSLVFEIQNGLY